MLTMNIINPQILRTEKYFLAYNRLLDLHSLRFLPPHLNKLEEVPEKAASEAKLLNYIS